MPPAKSKTGRPSVWAPAIGGANAALEADSLKLQQVLLITAFLASALFFSGASFASFELPKFVAIGTLVIVAAGISAARAVLGGLVVLPRWEATIAIALFIAGLAVATLTSPSFHISVIGNYTRFTGFVPYALYAMAFLLVLRSFDERAVRRLGVSVIAAAALAAFYGLLQWGGADPIRWGGVYAETVFATFGNPNFAAGWFAMALPFAAWGALRETWAWQWRIASALVGVASLLVISATDAEQGIFAGGAGVAVFALAWLRARLRDDLRTAVTAGWAVLAVAVTTLAALGLATIGPLSALGTQSSFALRKTYWEAALRMFASDVPTGVGLDMFASYFPAYRSREALELLGPGVTIDQPHSVPLAFLSGGGLVLAVGYLAVVGVVLWALVVGFRRLEGEPLLLLGAFGGGWVAYQVESLVTIDLPSIAFPNWVFGAVVVLVGLGRKPVTFDLPWGRAHGGRTRGQRRGGGAARRRQDARRMWIPVAVLAAVALWAASIPMRADAAYGNSQAAMLTEDYGSAQHLAARAVKAASWWPEYWYGLSIAVSKTGQPQDVISFLREMLARDPLSVTGWHFLARVHQSAGHHEEAVAAYERLLELDPLPVEHRAEFAQALFNQGNPSRAEQLLEPAIGDSPNARFWLLLGRIYVETGQPEEARGALERVLELAVEGQAVVVAEAQALLDELGMQTGS